MISGRPRSTGLDDSSPLVSARRSVSVAGGREADIEVRFGDEQRPFVVEIEDKIDAEFTGGQPEAYAARVANRSSQSDVAGGAAVLLAPAGYVASLRDDQRDCFGALLSHEDLRDLLASEGPWGHALGLVLEHSIRQHRRSGSRTTDADFTAALRRFAAHAPGVGLPEPTVGDRSASTELWFAKPVLTQLSLWVPETQS